MKWSTRNRVKVDRVGCPWLVKRFIDKDAELIFLPSDKVMEEAKRFNVIPYWVKDVEPGHHGEECSFEAILKKHQLRSDTALVLRGNIVDGADTESTPDYQPEGPGLKAIAEVFRHLRHKEDHAVKAAAQRFLSESRRVRRSIIGTFAISVAVTGLPAGAASPAELKVLASGPMLAAVQELAGTFEASSGHKLVIEYAMVGKIADRVAGDDPIDVAILTKPLFDKLVGAGKMVGSTTGQLARVSIGLAVRQGVPKPDISSVEAFKRTLLDAKFITYGNPGMGDAAGVHLAKIIETLGLAGELEPKTRLISPAPGQSGAQFLTGLFQRGDTEIAMAPISVLRE